MQQTQTAAVDAVDAIIFTHGSDGQGKAGSEAIGYGGVRNVLAAARWARGRYASAHDSVRRDRRVGAYNCSNDPEPARQVLGTERKGASHRLQLDVLPPAASSAQSNSCTSTR